MVGHGQDGDGTSVRRRSFPRYDIGDTARETRRVWCLRATSVNSSCSSPHPPRFRVHKDVSSSFLRVILPNIQVSVEVSFDGFTGPEVSDSHLEMYLPSQNQRLS